MVLLTMKKYQILAYMCVGALVWLAGCSDDTPTGPPDTNDTIDTSDTITYDPVGSNIEMIAVEPGTFQMGANYYVYDEASELPRQMVTLTRAFELGKYEITNMEWYKIMGGDAPNDSLRDRPFSLSSFYQIVEFCNALSKREGLDTAYVLVDTVYYLEYNANGYRTPTEAEWEYACRAGTNMDTYICSFEGLSDKERLDTMNTIAWNGWSTGIDRDDPGFMPVGLLLPNAWGFYDMLGNAGEVLLQLSIPPTDRSSIDPYHTGPIDRELLMCFRGGTTTDTPIIPRCGYRGSGGIEEARLIWYHLASFRIARNLQ